MVSHGPGKLQPTELRDARVQLHWAAQVLSSAADGWLPPRLDADRSKRQMRWSPYKPRTTAPLATS
jgi:hypothetical protein